MNHNQVGKWGTLSPTCRKKGKLAVHRISTRLWVDFSGDKKNAFFLGIHVPTHPNISPTYEGTLILCPAKNWVGEKIRVNVQLMIWLKTFAVIFDLGFDLSLSNRSGGSIASLNWTDLAPGSNCAL